MQSRIAWRSIRRCSASACSVIASPGSWWVRAELRSRQDGGMLRRPVAVAALLAAALGLALAAHARGTDQRGARVVSFRIASPLVHATMPVAAVIPAGAA